MKQPKIYHLRRDGSNTIKVLTGDEAAIKALKWVLYRNNTGTLTNKTGLLCGEVSGKNGHLTAYFHPNGILDKSKPEPEPKPETIIARNREAQLAWIKDLPNLGKRGKSNCIHLNITPDAAKRAMSKAGVSGYTVTGKDGGCIVYVKPVKFKPKK